MLSPQLPVRHTLRLSGYDYSTPGAYFITLCAEKHACLFGTVRGDLVDLSPLGSIVNSTWTELPSHLPGIRLDEFVVMPNHLHAIVVLDGSSDTHMPAVAETRQRDTTTPLPDLVRRFKTLSTTRAIRSLGNSNAPLFHGRLWQRSYHDHVIRSDESLERIRDYVATNPIRWALDRENPECSPASTPPAGFAESWMV